MKFSAALNVRAKIRPMPVRAIPISHRSVTGRLASRPGQPAIAFESSLERDFALLQLFDLTVESVEEQPVRIDYLTTGGRPSRYTPDFLVIYKSNRPSPRLVEVKYRAELEEKADQYAARFDAARIYAAGRGWRFEVATEETIRTPRLGNARFLLPYRRQAADPGHCCRLMDTLSTAGSMAVGDLLRSVFPSLEGQQQGLPSLWHLVATGRITADFDQPLTMASPLRTA